MSEWVNKEQQRSPGQIYSPIARLALLQMAPRIKAVMLNLDVV